MDTERRRLRRELYGLVALELFQRTIAIATLVAIATYAAFIVNDALRSAVIASFVVLALLHLANALRIRAGGDLIRRDIAALEWSADRVEARDVLAARCAGGGPYRSLATIAAEPGFRRAAHLPWLVLIGDALVLTAMSAVAVFALG